MREIILTVDREANRTVQELMSFYDMKSEHELFGWGLKLALLSASADDSEGKSELILRTGSSEKKVSFK